VQVEKSWRREEGFAGAGMQWGNASLRHSIVLGVGIALAPFAGKDGEWFTSGRWSITAACVVPPRQGAARQLTDHVAGVGLERQADDQHQLHPGAHRLALADGPTSLPSLSLNTVCRVKVFFAVDGMMKKVKPVMNAEAMTNCSWLVRVDSAYRSDSTLRIHLGETAGFLLGLAMAFSHICMGANGGGGGRVVVDLVQRGGGRR
jgi:hypothetical protein